MLLLCCGCTSGPLTEIQKNICRQALIFPYYTKTGQQGKVDSLRFFPKILPFSMRPEWPRRNPADFPRSSSQPHCKGGKNAL